MKVRDQDWVTIMEASGSTKVPATTITDWCRSGVIDSMTTSEGARLVSLPGVRAHAAGDGRHDRGQTKGRMSRTPAQLQQDGQTATTLNRAVNDLQGMARERLEPQE